MQKNDQLAACNKPIAVVTGCAGGMGQVTVRCLIDAGWRVWGIDAAADRLQKQKKELPPDLFAGVHADLASSDIADSGILPHDNWWDNIRAFVHIAGLSAGNGWDGNVEACWDEQLNVQARSALYLIQQCARPMQHAGTGKMLITGSPVGVVGARKPGYAASKAALQGLTMSAARYYGQYNICINMLLPGPTTSFMTQDWSPEKQTKVASGTFLDRMCRPQEIGELITFLISDRNSFMSGSVIDASCGSMYGH